MKREIIMKHFVVDGHNPRSKSGRKLTPIPTTKLSPKGRNLNKINREWREWLITNAREEVTDDYHKTLIDAVDLDNFSVADGDFLNDLLFGDPFAKIDYNLKTG